MCAATSACLSVAMVITGQVSPLDGTLVSGIACYDANAPGRREIEGATTTKPPVWIPVEGLRLYAAKGKHTGSADEDQGIIYECNQVWQRDVTSRESDKVPLVAAGHFHFYHRDRLNNGVSVMYRLDDSALPEGRRRTRDRRYFSRFYATDPTANDFSVKVRFPLHPTDYPSESIEQAADQIGQSVAVQFFVAHIKGNEFREFARLNEETMRRSIRAELGIVFDSLRRLDLSPRAAVDRLFARLERYHLRVGDELIPVIKLIPEKDDGFWAEYSGAFERERERLRGRDGF